MLEYPWKRWRHVIKLDPDRTLPEVAWQDFATCGTDAVMIGGTQGITYAKVQQLVDQVRAVAPELPVWQEVSNLDAVVADVDGYSIPVVLNAASTEWLIGRHVDALERIGDALSTFSVWDRVFVEGYICLNPMAAVSQLTGADTAISAERAAAFATAGERLFGMQAIYVEYSGTYGDPTVVKKIREKTSVHLISGGGISTSEQARTMAEIADTIVVGNAIYEQGMDVARITADAVREVRR